MDELRHYGIKGQKWGIRRYQNKDGTLTSAGKRRYNEDESARDNDPGKSSSTRKQRNKMSDADLAAKIARLKKETELKDLEKRNRDDGEQYTKEILKDIGRRVLTTAVTGAILYGGKVIIGGDFKPGELANAIFYGGAKKK